MCYWKLRKQKTFKNLLKNIILIIPIFSIYFIYYYFLFDFLKIKINFFISLFSRILPINIPNNSTNNFFQENPIIFFQTFFRKKNQKQNQKNKTFRTKKKRRTQWKKCYSKPSQNSISKFRVLFFRLFLSLNKFLIIKRIFNFCFLFELKYLNKLFVYIKSEKKLINWIWRENQK